MLCTLAEMQRINLLGAMNDKDPNETSGMAVDYDHKESKIDVQRFQAGKYQQLRSPRPRFLGNPRN